MPRFALPPRAASRGELERLVDAAADYLAPIRDASSPVKRLRAAAAADGPSTLVTLMRSLPVERAAFSHGPAGTELRSWFRPDRRWPVDRAPIAMLALPATYQEHLRGRPRQALRTNLTQAARAGLKALIVESPLELHQAAAHIAAQRGTTASALLPLHLAGVGHAGSTSPTTTTAPRSGSATPSWAAPGPAWPRS